MVTIFFFGGGGELGILGGEASNTSNTLDRTLNPEKGKAVAILLGAPETRYKSQRHGSVGITEFSWYNDREETDYGNFRIKDAVRNKEVHKEGIDCTFKRSRLLKNCSYSFPSPACVG